MTKIRTVMGILLAGFISEFIHRHVGYGVTNYNLFIDGIAYLTKPLEAVGVAIIYYFIGDRLPGRSPVYHGMLLGLLMLLVKGQLIRQPLMNFLLPNTLTEVLVFESQLWLANFAVTIIICFTVTPKYKKSSVIE